MLILSARGQIADKVEGLDAGANDYMEKPFHLQELEARIRSLTRRKFVQRMSVWKVAGSNSIPSNERPMPTEPGSPDKKRKRHFGISASSPWQTGKPGRIDQRVWDASVDSFSGSIRVHMSSLRRKLRAVLGYDPILNKVGEGYQIREESDR